MEIKKSTATTTFALLSMLLVMAKEESSPTQNLRKAEMTD